MGNLLRHLFLPHPSNNHKARLLHHSALLLYIGLFIISQVFLTFLMVTNPSVLGLATDINVNALMDGVNKRRIENGLSALRLDNELSQAANNKAQDMFSKNYWAHFAPDGTTPWYFISQAGYSYKYAGENLARDFAVSDQVVSAWMNSPTHKKNLLDTRFEDVGFAVVNGTIGGQETTLVVQLFGTRGQGSVQIVSAPPSEAPQTTPAVVENKPAQNAVSITPTPLAGQVIGTNKTTLIAAAQNAVVKKPVINIFSLTKKISFALGLFLIILLYVDASLIFKKKIYRISGNNVAHILFFLFLLLALYWSEYGVII